LETTSPQSSRWLGWGVAAKFIKQNTQKQVNYGLQRVNGSFEDYRYLKSELQSAKTVYQKRNLLSEVIEKGEVHNSSKINNILKEKYCNCFIALQGESVQDNEKAFQ